MLTNAKLKVAENERQRPIANGRGWWKNWKVGAALAIGALAFMVLIYLQVWALGFFNVHPWAQVARDQLKGADVFISVIWCVMFLTPLVKDRRQDRAVDEKVNRSRFGSTVLGFVGVFALLMMLVLYVTVTSGVLSYRYPEMTNRELGKLSLELGVAFLIEEAILVVFGLCYRYGVSNVWQMGRAYSP